MSVFGEVSVEVKGAQRSPIVDRVVVSMIRQPPEAGFYSLDLAWNAQLGSWIGAHEAVVEGHYSLVVDAAVDDLVLWRAYETELDVVAGRMSMFEFSIQDKVRIRSQGESIQFRARPETPDRV